MKWMEKLILIFQVIYCLQLTKRTITLPLIFCINETFHLALDNGEMISKFDFKALALSYIEVSQ